MMSLDFTKSTEKQLTGQNQADVASAPTTSNVIWIPLHFTWTIMDVGIAITLQQPCNIQKKNKGLLM